MTPRARRGQSAPLAFLFAFLVNGLAPLSGQTSPVRQRDQPERANGAILGGVIGGALGLVGGVLFGASTACRGRE